jgi:aspartoacylase
VLQASICRQTQVALEASLQVLAEACCGTLRLPPSLIVHRHLGSVDLPRRPDGSPAAVLHPALQGADWRPLGGNDAVLLDAAGRTIRLDAVLPPALAGRDQSWPVFINEAAYDEKGIAFSLTSRESWPLMGDWRDALIALSQQLQRGLPL